MWKDVCIISEYSGSPVTQSTLCTTVFLERSVEASCEYLFGNVLFKEEEGALVHPFTTT